VYTFIDQGCIKLINSDSTDIYNVAKVRLKNIKSAVLFFF